MRHSKTNEKNFATPSNHTSARTFYSKLALAPSVYFQRQCFFRAALQRSHVCESLRRWRVGTG